MSLQQKFYPVSAMNWWTVSNISITYNVSNTKNSTDFIPRTYRSLNAPSNWTLGCVQPEPIISKGKSKVQLQFEQLYVSLILNNISSLFKNSFFQINQINSFIFCYYHFCNSYYYSFKKFEIYFCV